MFNIDIINDSCFNYKEYLKEKVDMFFCDPPYFISGGKTNDNIGGRKEWDRQWKNEDEFLVWTKEWMQEMFNSLSDTGSAYVCIDWKRSSNFHLLLKEIGFKIQNRITWKRDKGRGSNTNWKSVSEDIWFVTKSNNYTFNIEKVKELKKVIAPYRDDEGNPKDWWVDSNGDKVRKTHPSNVWIGHSVPFWSSKEVKSYAISKASPDNKYKKHETQKPLSIVKRCIEASSNENDLICDFFNGSGTSAVASKLLNRRYIGFEINKEYVDITKLRLQKECVSTLY
jgi:site-specific DNA-methyltransferase (adenine-specific)